ncbi:MAG: NADH:flavin oxidoreductase/NADH oxidase family protein [Thiolinea sp.]
MTEQTLNHESNASHHILGKPLQLPCGVTLKNRLAKSAMSDSLGDGAGDSTQAQARLYERWAEGGAALSLIGEVQVSPHFPEKPGNLVLTENSDQQALQSLARYGTINSSQLWPQLGHAGALAHGPISQPKGPSALNLEGLQCSGMSVAEVEALPTMYAKAASITKDAGFSGVQIHAGHGFLFSQFLSPLFNHREDYYGGSVAARCQIILETIAAVRQSVGSSFPIGIKINSTDKLEGGLSEEEALEVVRLLDQTSVDLIDISGGTYFPGAKSSSDSTSNDGPYFLSFAKRAKAITDIPLMLTGGFARREQAIDAVLSGAADVVSLGRAMALNPQLAHTWLSEAGGNPEFPVFNAPPKGSVTAWYTMLLTALAEDRETSFGLDPQTALEVYEQRDAERCSKWIQRFS